MSTRITPNQREIIAAVDSVSGKPVYPTATNNKLDVNATASLAGSSIPITGATTAVGVAIVDGSGNQITSFGGGTQYAELATTSPGTGTLSIGRYKASAPTLTDGQLYGLQLDSSGNLKVTGSISVGGTTDEASFTAGSSTFNPTGGVFNDAATALSSGQQGTQRFTTNRAGHVNLRTAAGVETGIAAAPLQVSLANTAANATAVKVDGSGVTQPVSGTVTANAGTNLNTSLLALESGGNLATTATNTGTLAGAVTSSVVQENVKQINGITPLMGNGVTGTGSQRVTIASDNTAFSVNATLSAETTKVIGVTRTADGAGNLLTSNSTTPSAKFALDSNITSILGTAPTTVGKLDVKGADGDVFVRQTTAANLNATVVQGTAAALALGWPTTNGELSDVTGTFTNATQTTSVTATGLDGYATFLISINGTYGTASAVFEGSDDSGTTWYGIDEADRTDSNVVEGGYTSLTNTNRAWQISNGGWDSLRVRSTAVASGTVNVRISPSAAPSSAGATVAIGAALPAGTNVIGHIIADSGSTTAVTSLPAIPTGTNAIGTVGTTSAAINVGQQTVSTTAVQVSASSTVPTNGIIIQALSTNAASIFVGGSGVTTSTGFELVAGQAMSFSCNLNTLYIRSVASTTDKICWNVE